MQAVDFKKALGCDKVGVLDMGAGSGLLSMMAARYRHTTNPPPPPPPPPPPSTLI